MDNSCFQGGNYLTGTGISFLPRTEEQVSTLNEGNKVIHKRIEKLVC